MKFVPSYLGFEDKIRKSFKRQKFMDYIGAELKTITPGYCEIHLPYKEVLAQQNGYFHAGVVGTIADNAGGYAAFTLMSKESSILTVEYKINFVSPAIGEKIIARGNVIKHGKNLSISKVTIHNWIKNKEKICAISQMTLMCLGSFPKETSKSDLI